MHCDIGCEYRISYRVGVSYTFYAGSCRLPGIQSPTRTRSGINSGRRFYAKNTLKSAEQLKMSDL